MTLHTTFCVGMNTEPYSLPLVLFRQSIWTTHGSTPWCDGLRSGRRGYDAAADVRAAIWGRRSLCKTPEYLHALPYPKFSVLLLAHCNLWTASGVCNAKRNSTWRHGGRLHPFATVEVSGHFGRHFCRCSVCGRHRRCDCFSFNFRFHITTRLNS